MSKITLRLARLQTVAALIAALFCPISPVTAPAWSLELDSSTEDSLDAPIEDKWALVVGISKFENPQLNLQFPAKDATDFAAYLTKDAHFAPDHVKLLTDENATKENILKLLGDSWLPRVAHPHDLVVIYVSSHGSPSTMDVRGTNYLVAYNTDPESLYATGLKMQELTSAIKERVHADRIVVILDACHSGSARAAKDLSLASNFDAETIANGVGQMVICSSKPNQVSFESKRAKNGVFTEQLLAGLRTNGDKTTMKDAFKVMKDGVENEVLTDRGELQTPVIKMKWEGEDLVLATKPSKPRPAPEPDRVLPKHKPVAVASAATARKPGMSQSMKPKDLSDDSAATSDQQPLQIASAAAPQTAPASIAVTPPAVSTSSTVAPVAVASAALPTPSYAVPNAAARTAAAARVASQHSHSGRSVDWEKVLEKGNQMLSIGQSKEAAAFFEGKVHKYPDSGACHTALGRALKRLGKIDQAENEFRAATEADPGYGEGFYEYACMLESDKQYKQAASLFQRFLELEPSAAQRKNVPDRVKFCMSQ